jgi:hypothetical protein
MVAWPGKPGICGSGSILLGQESDWTCKDPVAQAVISNRASAVRFWGV